MPDFHHHPDGLIYLRGGERPYAATLDDFRRDLAVAGLPPYDDLPDGVRERRYGADGRHRLFTADSQLAGAEPWPAGEAYLAALPLLCAQADIRQEEPPQEETNGDQPDDHP